MNKNKIVIFGLGDIAQLANFYFQHDSNYKVVAFTADSNFIDKNEFCDLPVVPFENIEEYYPSEEYSMFIAVSYVKLNMVRLQKYLAAKTKGYTLVNYISSKATTWPGMNIGENCFILEDNTIQPFASIGNNVTLWSGNHIGHHSEIHDNCFISSHVVVSGGVKIGRNCFIGVNSTIRDHVNIGENCIIAAGSLVIKDTNNNGVYMGQPAKLHKLADETTTV